MPRNYQRDGPMTVTNNQGGAPNYFPNSFSGPQPNRSGETCHSFVKIVTGFIWLMMLTVEVLLIRKWLEHASPVSGDVTRWNSADEDNFTQVGKESIIIFYFQYIFYLLVTVVVVD